MIGFSENVYSVLESEGSTSVCVDMARASERGVPFSLTRTDAESQDFVLADETTLVFPIGETQVCIPIIITNDAIVEGEETFTLEVSTSDTDVGISRMSTILIITDDDGKQLLTLACLTSACIQFFCALIFNSGQCYASASSVHSRRGGRDTKRVCFHHWRERD